MLISNSSSAAASLLGNIKSIVGIVGPSITALALIITGIWAYFKFVKGRTFKDRLQVDLDGWWHIADGRNLLQARVTLKNIGSSRILLLQDDTRLQVSRLAAREYQLPGRVAWRKVVEKAKIFGEHDWIEPGESVSDDVLLDLETPEPITTLFEVWLVCRRDEVFRRRIISANSTVNASMRDGQELTVGLADQNIQDNKKSIGLSQRGRQKMSKRRKNNSEEEDGRLWRCPACNQVESSLFPHPRCSGTPENPHEMVEAQPILENEGVKRSYGSRVFK